MHLRKITIDKNILLVTYKLLHDALFLILLAFAGTLVADALLPGLITSKISFSKITLLLVLTVGAIVYLGKKLQITYPEKKLNKSKILPALILFSFLLIGNSLLKFTFWENIVITLVTLFIFFLFFELIFSSEEK
ncbi:MAG: hypothetical protein ACD_67C00003G0004 [uncultured bacterium]|nr:MAG: hypothetical protein ACD_67C00003G0004 [uncultured bacterium]